MTEGMGRHLQIGTHDRFCPPSIISREACCTFQKTSVTQNEVATTQASWTSTLTNSFTLSSLGAMGQEYPAGS